jgi:hypothetical protein
MDQAANQARACSAEGAKSLIRSGLTAADPMVVVACLAASARGPTRYSRPTTFMIAAMASVLASARTRI